MTAVERWVNREDPDFFSSGLMALEHRWSTCITLEGNIIEKKRWISTGYKLGRLLIDSPSYISQYVCGNMMSIFTRVFQANFQKHFQKNILPCILLFAEIYRVNNVRIMSFCHII